MKHLDPIVDHQLREESAERMEEKAFWSVKIDDVFKGPIELFSHQWDCNVSAHVTRKGLHGDLELDDIEIGLVYLYLNDLPDPLVEVNQDQLRSRHRSVYEMIVTAAEAEAIKQASLSNDWVMGDVDADFE